MSIILKNKKVVIALISVFIVLLIIPILFFIVRFKSNLISNDISDWASFGDYLGGTLKYSYISFKLNIVRLFNLFIK